MRFLTDALSPLLFNFALEYAIWNVQETNLGLDINGTHQILAFADDVNLTPQAGKPCTATCHVTFNSWLERIIGDDIRTIERNADVRILVEQ